LAFKALGASLLGPAGVGIALSVVSSAILFYQQYQQKSKRTTEDAKKSNEEYADSLGQVTRASLLGAQSAIQETTVLSQLFKQYTNGELTLAKRKSAYDELQRLYPAYFGNIKFEQEASNKTKEAYDRLTTSIIATARARAAGDLITKNSQRQLENEQKLIDLRVEANKAYTTALKSEEKAKLAASSTGESGERIALSLISKANTERTRAAEIQKQINNIVTDSILLNNKNLQLEKSITAEIEKGAVLSGNIGGASDSNKNIKTQSDILKQLKIDLLKVNESVDITFGEGNKQRVSAFAKAIDELITINGDKTIISKLKDELLNIDPASIKQSGKTVGVTLSTGISEGFQEAIPVVATDLGNRLKGGLTEWQSYVNNDLLPSLQNNFQSLFNDILMRGKLSFDSLGKAILNTFISVLASEAAKGLTDLLKFNTGQEYSDSLKKGKGGGLIGGLIGLIGGKGDAKSDVGGEVVKKGLGGILGTILPAAGLAFGAISVLGGLFKKRKIEPQPAFTTSNAISTSSSSNVDFGSGRVVFEISGVNLVGVLNRAGAKLQRFGP
jgi:hypothetical protein